MHRSCFNVMLKGINDKFCRAENFHKMNNLTSNRNFTMSDRTKIMSIEFYMIVMQIL